MVFASLHSPKHYSLFWRDLSETFQTNDKPAHYTHQKVPIYRPTTFGRWYLDDYYVGEYALFDVELDTKGIWLRNDTPGSMKVAERMLIPWTRIGLQEEKKDRTHFWIFASKPVEVAVPVEFGKLLLKAGGKTIGGE